MEKQRLNVDVARAVSEFADVAKEFELKEKLYRIIFRGKALEFESYRDFVPDDDANTIDWKASMRANKTLVKQYRVERDLNIFVVVDTSDNMVFGSEKQLKCEYAVSMLAGLIHLMMGANDNIGLVMFNEKVVSFIEPGKGNFHFDLLMDTLTKPELYGGKSNVDSAVEELLKYPNTLDATIFVSDFIRFGPEISRKLIALRNRGESVAISIKDPLDKKLPMINKEVIIENPQTGEQLLVNPSVANQIYQQQVKQQEAYTREIFKRSNIDLLELTTNRWFPVPLAQFLEERVRKRGLFI